MRWDEQLRWTAYWSLDLLKGSPVRSYYNEIKDSWQKGTPIEKSDRKIRDLIRHAVRTTQAYRDFPEDILLEKLPVRKKEDYRQDYDRYLSDLFRDADGNRFMYTSGSTGTPFMVTQNKDKIRHNTAASIFLGAAGGYYIGMKDAFIRMWVGDHAKKSRLSRFAENLVMMDCSNLDDAALGSMLDTIKKKKVSCLIGYSTVLGELSRYIDRYRIDTSGFTVKAILPISESMPEEIQKRLGEQFHCPVRAWYSNEENGIMALQKEGQQVYRVDTESYYYEILKLDADEPAEEGELGRIVITDLYNYALPMIRYENGDLAMGRTIEKNGRRKQYLTELYGRKGDMIYDCQGRMVSPFVFLNNFATVRELKQFRFIQETETTYTLWLQGDREKLDTGMLLGMIRPYFGEEAEIRVEFMEDIPVLRSGKRKYLENRCEKYTSGKEKERL